MTSSEKGVRHYIFVTNVYGNVDIYAHDLDTAKDDFFKKGYVLSDILEIR